MLSDKQFHWQFLITNSFFWLISVLLQKFYSLSKKDKKKTQIDKKHKFYDEKRQKMPRKFMKT